MTISVRRPDALARRITRDHRSVSVANRLFTIMTRAPAGSMIVVAIVTMIGAFLVVELCSGTRSYVGSSPPSSIVSADISVSVVAISNNEPDADVAWVDHPVSSWRESPPDFESPDPGSPRTTDFALDLGAFQNTAALEGTELPVFESGDAWVLVGSPVRVDPSDVESQEQQRPSGEELFVRDWSRVTPPPGGDGLGPLFNAKSCAACHFQGGIGGGGSPRHNVQTLNFTRTARQNPLLLAMVSETDLSLGQLRPTIPILHRAGTHKDYSRWRQRVLQFATGPSADPRIRAAAPLNISERNTPALFGTGLIDQIPDEAIRAAVNDLRFNPKEDSVTGRVATLPDRRIGRFGWRGERATLSEFVKGACAMELGLNLPGNPQPSPAWDQNYVAPEGYDMTEEETEEMIRFVAELPQPQEVVSNRTALGKELFSNIGCAACHHPNLGEVEGLYSDLLLHDMGPSLSDSTTYYGGSSSGTIASGSEWQTPPLWGVADSAPYLHDGRARNLHEALLLHGGEADDARLRYVNLPVTRKNQLMQFLLSLKAPR